MGSEISTFLQIQRSSSEKLWDKYFLVNTVKFFGNAFFSRWVFFHEHLRFTGQQGKRDAISLTPLYHFHPFHRHFHSRAITEENSTLQIASSQTRTGNLWFPSASHKLRSLKFNSYGWSLSVPSERIRNHVVFLCFQGGIWSGSGTKWG